MCPALRFLPATRPLKRNLLRPSLISIKKWNLTGNAVRRQHEIFCNVFIHVYKVSKPIKSDLYMEICSRVTRCKNRPNYSRCVYLCTSPVLIIIKHDIYWGKLLVRFAKKGRDCCVWLLKLWHKCTSPNLLQLTIHRVNTHSGELLKPAIQNLYKMYDF